MLESGNKKTPHSGGTLTLRRLPPFLSFAALAALRGDVPLDSIPMTFPTPHLQTSQVST